MNAVYSITHRDTGREYIGYTSRDVRARWGAHIDAAPRSQMRIGRAINKYSSRAFDFQVVAMLPTVAEAQIAEMLLIATRRPALNVSRGGMGGMKGVKHPPRSAETLRRLSESHIGVSNGPRDTRKAVAASVAARIGKRNPQHAAKMTGRKASEETRARMSASQRARCADPAMRAIVAEQMRGNRHAAGRVPSAETLAKRAATRQATLTARSPEAKQAASNAVRRAWETRRAKSQAGQ